jgi:ribose/xylose/arabinose/galactoside ABC-type transport system permease subunit
VNFVGLTYLIHSLVPLLADGASIVNLASLARFEWERNSEIVKRAFSGSVAGLLNGSLIAYTRIPPFIATLVEPSSG